MGASGNGVIACVNDVGQRDGLLSRPGRLVLERLMGYYRYVAELTTKEPVATVTSAQVAQELDITPTQVRKDLRAIGLQGVGRAGYDVREMCRAIRCVLGFDEENEAVLIGAGHLGGALLAYSGFASGFSRYGLHIVAVFDNDKSKIGSRVAQLTVKPMQEMKPFVRSHSIRLAILTIPAEVSQRLTDHLISAGVKAIWNFSSARLAVPSGILVRDEHISVGLSEIAYHLKR